MNDIVYWITKSWGYKIAYLLEGPVLLFEFSVTQDESVAFSKCLLPVDSVFV